MKIAVVLHRASTGGMRYSYQLLAGLKRIAPFIEITVFYSEEFFKAYPQITENIYSLKHLGIHLSNRTVWRAPGSFENFTLNKKFKNKILNNFWQQLRKIKFKYTHRGRFDSDMDPFTDFDLVFYPWPYDIEVPNTAKPVFYNPHDFILTHFFGHICGDSYSKAKCDGFLDSLRPFVEKGRAIVSSHYIKNEFMRLFPKIEPPKVVYLSALNSLVTHDQEVSQQVLDKYEIRSPYILLPTNNMHHKNMGQVLGAYYYIKQEYPQIKLIVTGVDPIEARCCSPYCMDHTFEGETWDLKALGLLDDEEFSILMQNAKVVVNASLMEAGNGSGLDAWGIGVPVAMSDIPSFKDQVDFLGVKAEFFDPRNSKDIARAVLFLLDNPEVAAENARVSQEALRDYSWDRVAEAYLNIFKGESK